MRLSIFAMPAQQGVSAQNTAPDGLALRSRLGLGDSGFEVADMDPGRDLAEQIETILASRGLSSRDAVMFYAGCPALLSVDGELFLCLDPSAPTVGDAVADVALVLRDHVPGPKLVVLDLVDSKATIDPARVEAFVRAATSALDPEASGIELVLAVRPRGVSGSPFVQAVLGEVAALERGRGLTTRGLFERISRKLADVLPVLHHARTKIAFEIVPLRVGKRDSAPQVSDVPKAPPVPVLSSSPPPPAVEGKAPTTIPPPAQVKPAGIATFRPPPADAVDMGWGEEDDFGASAPKIQPLRPLAAPPGASLPPPPMSSGTTILGTDGPVSAPRSGPISGRGISPFGRYTVEGELCASQGDTDGAIAAFRKALSVLGPAGDPDSRSEMYARIGEMRVIKGDNDGAISDFEKALALRPGHMTALESLITLCAAEKDWRGVMSAEERLLAALPSDTLRFERLIEFAARWDGVAEKPQRARVLFERAKELRPHDPIVLNQIRRLVNRSTPPPPKP